MKKRKWPSKNTCCKCRYWEDAKDTMLGEVDGAYHPAGFCNHPYVKQMMSQKKLATYCDFGCIFFEKPLIFNSPEWWSSKLSPNEA